jgi:hypothetical protein
MSDGNEIFASGQSQQQAFSLVQACEDPARAVGCLRRAHAVKQLHQGALLSISCCASTGGLRRTLVGGDDLETAVQLIRRA